MQDVDDPDLVVEEDGVEQAQEAEEAEGSLEEDGPSVTVQSQEVSSGTWGNCPWEIDGEGKLTIHPCAEGVDQEELVVDEASWNHAEAGVKDIAAFTSIEFASEDNRKVVMGSTAENLFDG